MTLGIFATLGTYLHVTSALVLGLLNNAFVFLVMLLQIWVLVYDLLLGLLFAPLVTSIKALTTILASYFVMPLVLTMAPMSLVVQVGSHTPRTLMGGQILHW